MTNLQPAGVVADWIGECAMPNSPLIVGVFACVLVVVMVGLVGLQASQTLRDRIADPVR